jgi:hypothetical protein
MFGIHVGGLDMLVKAIADQESAAKTLKAEQQKIKVNSTLFCPF